jgi:hypothetical protein
MNDPESDLSEPDFPWKLWSEIQEVVDATVSRSGLAASIQEDCVNRVFWLFFAAWIRGLEVRHPRAWGAKMARRVLWRERRIGHPLQLGSEHDEIATAQETSAAAVLPPDAWAFVQQQEPVIRERLSVQEWRVYEYVRDHRHLRGAAARLGMSARDVRVRFRRICSKLHGILRGFVPPPPLYLRSESDGPLG